MKRVFTLLFIVISAISSASAQLAQLDDGYYRIQCVETGRYISFRNNYVDEESFLRTTESQFWSLRTISGFENVVNDPGSVIYLKKHEQGWTLCSQDYDFDFFGSFFQITDMGDGTYRLWATYSVSESDMTITRYMRDCDDASGGFSYVTTETAISKGWNWRLIPVSSADQAYLGLVPEVKVGGKGYTTFYAGISVKLGSGMKAYAIDSETDATCTLMDIGSTIPAKTPVVIECAGDNAADNKLTPLETSSCSAGANYLKGVMFCYPVLRVTQDEQVMEKRDNPYWNTVDHDDLTMRVLGEEDGKLVFKKGSEALDYMPANKAYLSVPLSAAATLSTAPSSNIVFASLEVKAACVAKWDTNSDGELSYAEAAAVTSLVDPKDFEDPFALLMDVESDFTFDEFQYFTGVTSLTNYDFDEFEHLTSIVLPNSIQSIEDGAFYDCKLTSIHIPASVTDISDTYINESVIEVLYTPAFNSSFLQTITVDPGNTRYSSPTGSNVIIDKTSNTLIMGCRNTDFSKIPNTVTTIAMRAFEGVEFANPAVNLPTSVEAIKAYAFNYSNIISINLGELTRLTEIGLTAFKDCDGLTEVTLPASITTMERAIFAGCDNIIKVVSNREEPLANNNNNFDPDHIIAIYNNAVLYVPSGKVEAYTNAGWEEPFDDDLKSFRVITDGDHTDPEAIGGLTYNGSDQKLILPGTYRTGMMEYSLDGSTYSTSIPTGKEAGEYTVYYRKVGLSDASILKVTIAAPKTISVFSGSNLWAGYVATENLAIPTGLEAYVITNLGATTATASSLNYIPQGVPVLLKRNNASVNDYEISTGTGTAPTVNLLKTYDSDKSVSNREGFILYNDEFVLVNEGTLPAGRVFLPANKSGVALTRGIVTEGDDTTGIYNSKMDFDDSDKQWYDLQGRKLERKPTKKGIYILDGRKVVIK